MSTQPRVYLDFNATMPLVSAAREAMIDAMTEAGNPSSIHAEGRRVRDRVERARNQVAALVGRPREQIVFTSGGTEANSLGVFALAAIAERRGLPRVIATTSIEHPSLAGPVEALAARGWSVVALDPRADAVRPGVRPGVLAIAWVNHELGSIVSEELLAWARPALVHVDAVQAVGKLPLGAIDATSIAISAHKLGGPQGVGALAIELDEGLPLVDGGHQERGRRPGTENTLGIVGFGAAAAAVTTTTWDGAKELGRGFEAALRALGGCIHADLLGERTGTTVNAAWPGARGESIVMALDLEGISVSTGAACTSGSIQPSRVLRGLGLSDEQAREGVRFSLGPTTTSDELTRVLAALPRIVERARRHR